MHLRDVTLDRALLRFVISGEVPHDALEEARVKRAATYYSVDDRKRIWVLGVNGGWLRVPWMKDRADLVRETHEEAGLCSGEKLA